MNDETKSVDTVSPDETKAPSQDPLDKELAEKGLTPEQKEKAKHAISKTISKLQKKLETITGEEYSDEVVDDEDSKPLTVGDFKRMKAEEATKTALQLADAESDPKAKELLKYHLQNTIRPTGNPQEDFKLAKAIVNSVKNGQIAELAGKKGTAKTHSSGSGAPTKGEDNFVPTEQETRYMKPPFNLTKEKILEARRETQEQEGGQE